MLPSSTAITPKSIGDCRTFSSSRYCASRPASAPVPAPPSRTAASPNSRIAARRFCFCGSVSSSGRSKTREVSSSFHIRSASSNSPCATTAPLIAPTELPVTIWNRSSSSVSARHTPISYAPRLPPPANTNAVFSSSATSFLCKQYASDPETKPLARILCKGGPVKSRSSATGSNTAAVHLSSRHQTAPQSGNCHR